MTNIVDGRRALEALTTFQRLLWLDTVWTGYLEQAQRIPRKDVKHLRAVNNEMRKLLIRARVDAKWILGWTTRNRAFVKAEFDRFVQSSDSKPYNMNVIVDRVKKKGGIAKIVSNAAEGLIKHSAEEERLLHEKLRVIESGKFSEGDMRGWVVCMLLGGALGASIATGNVVGGCMALATAGHLGCI